MSQNSFVSGIHYFFEGLRLITHPKLRAYILVPLIINIILFLILTAALIHYFGVIMDSIRFDPPAWLPYVELVTDIISVLLGIVIGVLALIIYGYSFNVITNILAAPFYGFLAEKTEYLLTGVKPPPEPIVKMTVRVFFRELSKLLYFLVRSIVVMLIILLIAMLPIIHFIAPIIGLVWGAWSMAIQYADYAADNHQRSFLDSRNRLWQKKYSSIGFGGTIMVCSVIPVLNIIALPAAVTGGTLYWINELANCQPTD